MDPKVLELSLPPEWDSVRAGWGACHGLLSGAGLAADEADALSMVAQELIENAVKYGGDGAEAIRLSLRVEEEGVTLEVRSRVPEDGAHLATLGGAVEQLRASSDPYQAWVECLTRAAGRSEVEGVSELGLARIANEGRCALDYRVDAGVLAVSAVYRRDG
jgi:hypothetical protein